MIDCLISSSVHWSVSSHDFEFPFGSGWNCFQREAMSGKQLSPGVWKDHQAECSSRWKQLSTEEREVYEARAVEEQALREAAAKEPFPSKVPASGPAQDEAASLLTRNAKKSVAKQRVMVSYQKFRSAEEWASFDAGVFSADGCLPLDCIDIDSYFPEIQEQWDTFTQAAGGGSFPVGSMDTANSDIAGGAADAAEINHSICHHNHGGLCASTPHLDLITKFVHSMADHVETGNSVVLGEINLFPWLIEIV